MPRKFYNQFNDELSYESADGGSRRKSKTTWNDVIRENSSVNEQPVPLIDWSALYAESDKLEKERFSDLPPVEKVTYIESEYVKSLTQEDVDKIREKENNITVKNMHTGGPTDFKITPTFKDAFFPYPEILSLIERQMFEKPSPVQMQTWPIIMAGHDLIGIAQTGTGKTLAFLLPALLHIALQQKLNPSYVPEGPYCLILAPTRELAQQIQEQAVKYQYKGYKSVCVYGQGSKRNQRSAIEQGIEIVVATPGRLIDFANDGILCLREVSYLVLDEADRMLDMGFQPDILKIVSHLRPERQTILTSATWPSDVQYIAKRLMKDAVMVQIGNLDLTAVSTVTQMIHICEADDKVGLLIKELSHIKPDDRIIVFSNRKATVDHIGVLLLEHDIIARVMHGNLEQCDRESALEDLRTLQVNVLVATDVASRGLDVKNVTKVINLDLPKNLEEYVHRAGRTGRAGKTGQVLSFICWDDKMNAKGLIEILERSDQVVPEELRALAERAARYAERRQEGKSRGRDNCGRHGYSGDKRDNFNDGYKRDNFLDGHRRGSFQNGGGRDNFKNISQSNSETQSNYYGSKYSHFSEEKNCLGAQEKFSSKGNFNTNNIYENKSNQDCSQASSRLNVENWDLDDVHESSNTQAISEKNILLFDEKCESNYTQVSSETPTSLLGAQEKFSSNDSFNKSNTDYERKNNQDYQARRCWNEEDWAVDDNSETSYTQVISQRSNLSHFNNKCEISNTPVSNERNFYSDRGGRRNYRGGGRSNFHENRGRYNSNRDTRQNYWDDRERNYQHDKSHSNYRGNRSFGGRANYRGDNWQRNPGRYQGGSNNTNWRE